MSPTDEAQFAADAADFLELVALSVPEATGNEILALFAQALDVRLGGLATVVHVAGPTIEGGVLCTSCGTVLQDLYGQHVALDAEADWDLRHDHGWGEGTRVWELWRWGAPTVNPHALGAFPADQEPDPAQLERWCEWKNPVTTDPTRGDHDG